MDEGLKDSSEYLKILLEGANDIIYTLDPEGNFTFINQKIKEWGYQEKELLGNPLFSILAGSRQRGRFAGFADDEGGIYEVKLKDKKGETKDVIIKSFPLKDNKGKIKSVLGIARDITEQKRLGREIIQIEKLTSTGELAAGVAHEVRNPLSIVSGAAQYLQKAMGPNSPFREYTEAIIKNAQAVEAIIGELLDFTRPLPISLETKDIHDCLDKTLRFLQKKCFEQRVELVKKYDDKLPLIMLDEQHLGQVFLNLALNALQAMPNGGKLTINTKYYPDKQNITIEFIDTGYGISKENMVKIFAPFFSARSSGVGLGLAMSRKIVEVHGGSLEVESALGQGATFTILLSIENREKF